VPASDPTLHVSASSATALAPARWGRWLLVAALVTAVAHLLDPYAWQSLRDARVNERDWGRLLRSAGYVPTWLVGALALWLAGRRGVTATTGDHAVVRARLRREAWLLALVPALSGGVAELIKIAVRRLRPAAESAAYAFRPYDVDFWSTRGLGFASSHTAVAFGAAALLARRFPGSAPAWYLLAVGCALTRVMAGAHFLSDTVGAAALGWLIAEAAWRWHVAREP
jgi:membrane-associated phospholipid phosphatase